MKIFSYKKFKHGFTLIEVLVACTIISTSTFALMSASTKGIQLSAQALRQTQANMLLEEGAEAVKSIRDASWTNISGLTLDTNYYLTFNTGTNTWSLGTTHTATIDSIFTRAVVLSAVNRDANDDIAISGTVDTRHKKVTVTTSWALADATTSSKALAFYMSDIFN